MLTHTCCCCSSCCCFLYRNEWGRDQQTKHFFYLKRSWNIWRFLPCRDINKRSIEKKIFEFFYSREDIVLSPFVLGTFTLLPCWALWTLTQSSLVLQMTAEISSVLISDKLHLSLVIKSLYFLLIRTVTDIFILVRYIFGNKVN